MNQIHNEISINNNSEKGLIELLSQIVRSVGVFKTSDLEVDLDTQQLILYMPFLFNNGQLKQRESDKIIAVFNIPNEVGYIPNLRAYDNEGIRNGLIIIKRDFYEHSQIDLTFYLDKSNG